MAPDPGAVLGRRRVRAKFKLFMPGSRALMLRRQRSAGEPLIRLPAPSPRRRGEGDSRNLSVPLPPVAGHVPSPRFYGERVRVRGSHRREPAKKKLVCNISDGRRG
ncbi:hypothetical protein CUJ84_Chr005055 [Rhizobium leguminosarum]|uniref:Uncharacterized protein n=1 Tax=Rhizobium leguminosarum TaxID=384 RepID=A0A2K9ZAR1_RHILE|nr:hypothetical protein CUJ84_Chr005055 [Rhizobium leguminosarum]